MNAVGLACSIHTNLIIGTVAVWRVGAARCCTEGEPRREGGGEDGAGDQSRQHRTLPLQVQVRGLVQRDELAENDKRKHTTPLSDLAQQILRVPKGFTGMCCRFGNC